VGERQAHLDLVRDGMSAGLFDRLGRRVHSSHDVDLVAHLIGPDVPGRAFNLVCEQGTVLTGAKHSSRRYVTLIDGGDAVATLFLQANSIAKHVLGQADRVLVCGVSDAQTLEQIKQATDDPTFGHVVIVLTAPSIHACWETFISEHVRPSSVVTHHGCQ
jgi:hypothetical protein